MASKRYELVKGYYAKQLWTKKMLKNAVIKGWITQDEYDGIVGVTGAPAEADGSGGEAAPDYEQMAAEARAELKAKRSAQEQAIANARIARAISRIHVKHDGK